MGGPKEKLRKVSRASSALNEKRLIRAKGQGSGMFGKPQTSLNWDQTSTHEQERLRLLCDDMKSEERENQCKITSPTMLEAKILAGATGVI